jgi:6-phosphofructokinase 1
MNITPEQTVVERLGPRGIKSPLQLARSRGEGCGAFVPDEARVRCQIETGTGYDLPHDVYFEKAGPREGLFFEPGETKDPESPLWLGVLATTGQPRKWF